MAIKINETAYDTYAAAALQALIAKSKFLDREGEYGEKKTQEDIDIFKKDMANSAHHYAAAMMRSRQIFINWLETEPTETAK